MTTIDVERFMVENGLFRGWDQKITFEHIVRRLTEGTMFIDRDDESIRGVMTYRRFDHFTDDADELAWGKENKRGLFVYISELAIASRSAFTRIVDWFKEENPDWLALEYYAFRRGRLRRYTVDELERITERLIDE